MTELDPNATFSPFSLNVTEIFDDRSGTFFGYAPRDWVAKLEAECDRHNIEVCRVSSDPRADLEIVDLDPEEIFVGFKGRAPLAITAAFLRDWVDWSAQAVMH